MAATAGDNPLHEDLHRLRIEPVDGWAVAAADLFAHAIEVAVEHRERCLLALSGGPQPQPMFDELATRKLRWDRVVVLQIDELLVPHGDPRRHADQHRAAFGHLGATWLDLPVDRLLPGPDPDPDQLDEVIADTTAHLVEFADEPPVIDIAQLCLGRGGSTASLFRGDPASVELRRYLALTEPHDGHRRLTMTRPVFDRARLAIWLVRGIESAGPLGQLLAGDLTIPAGVIRPRQSIVIADTDAARQP